MQCPFLIGTTIYLRPLEREDAKTLLPWINDPEVTDTLLIYRPVNLKAEEAFIDNAYASEHDLVLGIVRQEGDCLLGVTGLHRMDFKNRHASFGIFIGEKSEWNKGFGTEATRLMVCHAFETLNLNRVYLSVYETNPRGIRAYEKVGFKREGVLRQDRYHRGRYWDLIIMALLRAEWSPNQ